MASTLTDHEINEWLAENEVETKHDLQKFLLRVIDDLKIGRINSREANKHTRYANAALMQLRTQASSSSGNFAGEIAAGPD